MMDFLDEYKPQEMQTGYLNDNKKGGLSKLRLTFIIEDKNKALELYTKMSQMKYLPETDQIVKIFYLKAEAVFEKYADEEAAIYEKDQEERIKKQQEKFERKKSEQYGNKRGGGRRNDPANNSNIDNEAVQKETGISFGGAKPVFTSTKPKVNAPISKVEEEVTESTEVRKVTYKE